MNCVKAFKEANALLDNLLRAVKESGKGRRVATRSLLADAALSAVELSKVAPGMTKTLSLQIAREAASLSNRPGQSISPRKIIELRELAKDAKRQAEIRCRV